jgi:integrase
MAATTSSAAFVPTASLFTNAERLALAGFLAGYSGLTRQAYQLDLRQFASWCQQHQLRLFGARRADIEFFARDLEARGRARATITRRLCVVAGFYKYAVEEELLDHSPAAHVRRRRAGSSLTRRSPNDDALRQLSGIALAGREAAGQQVSSTSPSHRSPLSVSSLTRDDTTPSPSDARTTRQKGKINSYAPCR